MEMKVQILEQEYWYGGYVFGSVYMPVGQMDERVIDLRSNQSPNQAAPLLLSSQGRYLWNTDGFLAEFKDGVISLDREVELEEGHENLRGAYLAAMQKHFPFEQNTLDRKFAEGPVYNTWIELTFYQNEKDVIRYAETIRKEALPSGTIMIDDGWSDYYGKWKFNKEKFPQAEQMNRKLHEMGFSVMLWICPFITPDTLEYRETLDKGLLIMTPEGKPLITEWWNGYSAALDLSNPQACQWLRNQLDELQKIGIDGFKLDAGDSIYYPEDMVTAGGVAPDEMSRLWCKFGEQYRLNEFRAAWRAGGMSLMQRLCDKPHNWENEGVGALLPDTLAQGILGMPFGSPDMIGGGEYRNFQENSDRLDQELFVRHAEIACLLPVMQFSAAPWRVLNRENFEKIKKSVEIRQRYLPELLQIWDQTAAQGEPIVRYMEYQFPHQGMETINDQFMLGDCLLVAPVCKKGALGRTVVLPEGEWIREDLSSENESWQGGQTVEVNSEPGCPVIFRKK